MQRLCHNVATPQLSQCIYDHNSRFEMVDIQADNQTQKCNQKVTAESNKKVSLHDDSIVGVPTDCQS